MNIENLCDKYQLDTLESKIVSYLYNNIDNLKNMGIRTVAKDNFTSTSTVFRLSKKLGFQGYSDMINQISSLNEENSKNDKFGFYINVTNEGSKKFDIFSSLIKKYSNKQIMIVGLGFSQMVANYINERLLISGFRSISTVHMQLLSETYKDEVLLIAISESGQTARLVDIVSQAKKNGLDIISFVGDDISKIAKYSTLTFPVEGYNKFNALNNIPNTFFGETILLFEYLIANYYK